jgi:uncharacterized protein (DUF1697 family)
VNVGGKNLLPMKELKSLLENAGFDNVKTYIQSGNIVLKSAKSPEKIIGELIQANFGFTPEIMTLSESKFHTSVSNNPYPEYEGKFVHFYFCKRKPKINSAEIEISISETERYQLIDNTFYLHAPDGIARSKLVASIEKYLGVPATGRNLNTVNKLKEILKNA